MITFNVNLLEPQDEALARTILTRRGDIYCDSLTRLLNPDLVIAPDGYPYLYRWHLIPRNDFANAYFHIQVASDPERPLHDHPYDNQSVILSGGYVEVMREPAKLPRYPDHHATIAYERRPGDVVHRHAEQAHRLILPPHVPYTMTLFTTGPRRRDWGFYAPGGWTSHEDIIETRDGMSVVKPGA